ncbi:fimbrial biogenesis chaperone [Providencia sp. Me31A]|uniref:fimbrial biogenesis chaperone n=1 Tax=Providencia sp. Me31A TaxID=3392637 RepID=UPI003D2D50FD
MKLLSVLNILLLFVCHFSFANNIIVNGTRFVYSENDKEITIQLNNTATRPAVAQIWLDEGNPKTLPEEIKTPFQIMPPISKLSANGGQTIRIKLVDKSQLPTDKEALYWLNLLDIPPITKSEKSAEENMLQLAIRSRFKFIYRPNKIGSRELAPDQLQVFSGKESIQIKNPTPFFITITAINAGNKTINTEAFMLAPGELKTIKVNSAVNSGDNLIVNNINDYGAEVPAKIKVR